MKIAVCCVLIIAPIILVGCGSEAPEAELSSEIAEAQPTANPTLHQVEESKLPKRFEIKYNEALARQHEIVKVEDSSLKAMDRPLSSYSLDEVNNLPKNKRKTYRVVVPADIKEEQVKPTIEKILAEIIELDNDIDEVTIFLYSDKSIATGPYDVATATWAFGGEWGSTTPEIARTNDRTGYKIVVEVKPDLEKYLKERSSSDEKFGLSDEKRKQIYKKFVANADKAQAEANEMYPTDTSVPGWQENVGKNNQMQSDLRAKYRSQLAEEYDLTEKQLYEVADEGFNKNWPMD